MGTKHIDGLDAQASAIAAEALAGRRDEAEALWQIAELVSRAGIGKSVVNPATASYGRQAVRDVAARIDELVMRKIVEQEGSRSNLSLSAVASGTSAVGWSRQLARSAYLSELRNYKRANHSLPMDLTASENERIYDLQSGAAFLDPTGEAGTGLAEVEAVGLLNELRARTWGTRPEHRVHEQARAAAAFLGVGDPGRVPIPKRRKLLAAIEANPLMPHTFVTRLVAGGGRDDVVAGLGAVFSTYNQNALTTIVEASPKFAKLLAAAAASPMPPISHRVLVQFRRGCADQVTEWPERRLVNRLTAAYATSYAEVLVTDRPGEERLVEAKTVRQVRGERAVFRAVAAQAAAERAIPFGDTVMAVERELRRVVDEVTTEVCAASKQAREAIF